MKAGTGDAANDNNAGVTKNYDYGVVYSTKRAEGEQDGEKKEGDGKREQREPREQQHRKQRKTRDHGYEFGKEKAQPMDDDDFTLVRDNKTRAKKTKVVDSDDSDED